LRKAGGGEVEKGRKSRGCGSEGVHTLFYC
jgi:hypothetical protein